MASYLNLEKNARIPYSNDMYSYDKRKEKREKTSGFAKDVFQRMWDSAEKWVEKRKTMKSVDLPRKMTVNKKMLKKQQDALSKKLCYSKSPRKSPVNLSREVNKEMTKKEQQEASIRRLCYPNWLRGGNLNDSDFELSDDELSPPSFPIYKPQDSDLDYRLIEENLFDLDEDLRLEKGHLFELDIEKESLSDMSEINKSFEE